MASFSSFTQLSALLLLSAAAALVLCNHQPNLWPNIKGAKFGAISYGQNPFRVYLSRGIIDCSTKYLITLRKLNKFIADAHAEMKKCQKMANENEEGDNNVRREENAGKNKELEAQMEMLGELLA